MKSLFLAFLMAFAYFLTVPASAQMAPQPQATVTVGTGGTVNLDFYGIAGRSYFIQYSEDLQTWNYFPVVELGANATISYGFSSTAPKFFVRLRYTDEPTDDAEKGDFDGDGLSNLDEISIYHTDPFNPDSNFDGMIDGDAVRLGLNPLNTTVDLGGPNDDDDGDGFTNEQENEAGTDPLNPNDHPPQFFCFYRGMTFTFANTSGMEQDYWLGDSWNNSSTHYIYTGDFLTPEEIFGAIEDYSPWPTASSLSSYIANIDQEGTWVYDWLDNEPGDYYGGAVTDSRLYVRVSSASASDRKFPFLITKKILPGSSTPISATESVQEVTVAAGQTVSDPLTVNGDLPTPEYYTYHQSIVTPISFALEHFEKIKDADGNDTQQNVRPGPDTVLRDEIVNLKIHLRTIDDDRPMTLEMDTEGMQTQTLGSRGAVQMYDFGTVDETTGAVTSLTANSSGITQTSPYAITIPHDSGDLTLRAVFNKEGTFKLRLKSPDRAINVVSQEFTVAERVRKYSEKVDSATDKDINRYDKKFVDIPQEWQDWRYKDNNQAGNFTFTPDTAPYFNPDLLKSICYTESNMNKAMALVKSPVPNDLMQVDAGIGPATPSMNGTGKDWNEVATTINITVQGGSYNGQQMPGYILDDNAASQTTTDGAALVRMRYNANPPGPAVVNTVDNSIRWAVRELLYKRFTKAIPANTIVEAHNDIRNFIIQKPTPLDLVHTLDNYGTGDGYGITILNLKNNGINPHDDGATKLYIWPILTNGKARGNN